MSRRFLVVIILCLALLIIYNWNNTKPYGDTLQLVWPTESPTINPCGVK